MRVLVSHPHAAAVSVAAARAFERSGRLAALVTGVTACAGTPSARALARLARRWPRLANRIVRGIGRDHLRALPAVELLGRALAYPGSVASRPRRTYDRLFALHDRAVARMRWPSGVDGVYAYEDAALKTLSRAAAMGAARILDLPSLHWGAQERIWRDEMERWPGAMATALVTEPAWKVRRKEGELALANVACVASSHAHRVLEDAGIRKPIVVAPYGFPVEVFTPDGRAGGEPFTVVSVGAHDLRKGTPYLLEAWRKAGIPGARLRLVGPMRLTPAFTSSFRDLFEHVPHVSRAELPRFYRSADVLAFPTLGDGFGLVIQEAMCCGTPVLTTPCGGGPDCIQDGVEGWIVPPRDVDALVERLRWAAANRDRLAEMGRAARRRAERYDERAAGEALVGALERALGAGGNHGAAPGQPDRASTSS